MADEAPRLLSREEFMASMVPSLQAMLAKLGKSKPPADVLAAKVYDQLALCGVTLLQAPPAKPHSIQGPVREGWKGPPL